MQDKQAQDKSGRQVLIRLRTEACVSLLRVWVLSVPVVSPLDHLPLGLAPLSLYSPTHMSSRKCASVSAVSLSCASPWDMPSFSLLLLVFVCLSSLLAYSVFLVV